MKIIQKFTIQKNLLKFRSLTNIPNKVYQIEVIWKKNDVYLKKWIKLDWIFKNIYNFNKWNTTKGKAILPTSSLAQGGGWYFSEKMVYICMAVLLWKCVLKAPPSAKLSGVGSNRHWKFVFKSTASNLTILNLKRN